MTSRVQRSAPPDPRRRSSRPGRARGRSGAPSAPRRGLRARRSTRRRRRRLPSAATSPGARPRRGRRGRPASTSCAKTSVSVSLEKRCPAAASTALRSAKFSKMPLWMTTILPVAVAVRVRVDLRGPPVGRPARVADSRRAGARSAALELRDEIRELAGTARDVEVAVRERRDAGRVVAPVLEPLQSLDQDGRRLLRSDVADYSAHGWMALRSIGRACDAHSFGLVADGCAARCFRRSTHPSTFVCVTREIASAPSGTSSVIVAPAPT